MRELLHISDIHFGPKFLQAPADGLLDLIDRRRPDLVVISGDLTQRAKVRQFKKARAWVDSIPVPTLAVPGNHDVPAYRFRERVFAPYEVYQAHFSADMEPTFEDDELVVIGVNTAFNWTVKDGRFTTAALARLDQLLTEAPDHKAKIIVAHHHLTPPPRFDTQRVTMRAREAIQLFSDHQVDMVLSGHLHQTYVTTNEEYYPTGGDPILLVHAGTATSSRGRGWERRRNSCNWIRIDEEKIQFHHLLWRDEQKAFAEWRRQVFPRRTPAGFHLCGRLEDAIC